MVFVITGATSFIGLKLINLLLSQRHSVVAVCRPNSKGLTNIPFGVTIVAVEMSDYGNLSRYIPEADVFINLAWGGTSHNGRNVVNVQKENIANTLAAMFAADKMGCQVFVESGSQAEYGSITSVITEDTPCNPFSEYGKAKLEVKEKGFDLAERLGLKYIHLRIFSIFGEDDHSWTLVMNSIDRMLVNEKVDLSPCTQNWNFLYVKDAVCQIVGLCNHAINTIGYKHEVYNIASKDTRVLKDFILAMKTLINSSSELNFGAIIPQNLVSLQPDVSKTENAIGFITDYSFEQVVKLIIEMKKNN